MYFDPESIRSIRESIEKVIVDEQLRIEISAKAKKKSKQYSWRRCANQTLEFLTQTIDEKN